MKQPFFSTSYAPRGGESTLDEIEDEPETSEEITSAHSDDAEVAGLEESEAKDLEELMVHA